MMTHSPEREADKLRTGAKMSWLGVALFIYVVLAGVEATRILVFAGPEPSDVGFYAWEMAPDERGRRLRLNDFRWTGERAALARSPEGRVITLTFYAGRPDLSEQQVSTRIALNDVPLDRVSHGEPGWHERSYYLPPVLGAISESAFEGPMPAPLSGWQELRPWSPPAEATWLALFTEPTFVPTSAAGSDDRRELGIGVGELRWSNELPAAGVGFHPEETTADEIAFQWTSRLWASRPLATADLRLALRADHPDIAQSPVQVTVYWNERAVATARLGDHEWSSVTPATEQIGPSPGVLSIAVDRTWSPARSGVSDDERELGVAVSFSSGR